MTGLMIGVKEAKKKNEKEKETGHLYITPEPCLDLEPTKTMFYCGCRTLLR